mmetsp:Transcript_164332/g.527000  ORF Transcript_164332/g.527000 Transcript_164332/m.527000 type:complete len:137 (-) Transcript_164332:229-639(-)
MGAESNDASEVAAEREAATHGCCCKWCSLRAEIWMCFVIDITSIIGLLIEIPGWYPVPARLHAVDEFRAYLVFSVFSAGIILFALIKGKEAAWPRRVLVRFMSFKLPIAGTTFSKCALRQAATTRLVCGCFHGFVH